MKKENKLIPALNALLEELTKRKGNPNKKTPHVLIDENGCWNWNRPLMINGYARFSFNKKMYYFHRFVYERLKGKIPEGLQIDHLCRNRSCCNPEHLEPVTPVVNTLRGFVGMKIARPKCPWVPPFEVVILNSELLAYVRDATKQKAICGIQTPEEAKVTAYALNSVYLKPRPAL